MSIDSMLFRLELQQRMEAPHLKRNLLDGYGFGFLKAMKYVPRKVPIKNGASGTPITGEVILMNQFGRNGVIRRKII